MAASRIAVDQGIPSADVSRWLGGETLPSIETAAAEWLEDLDQRALVKFDGFVMTPTSQRICDAFEDARAPRGRDGKRGMCFIFGASGAGKTITAEWYLEQCNAVSNNVAVMVRADGDMSTWTNALRAIMKAIGHVGYSNRTDPLREQIAYYIPVGGIIIIDEAHLLPVKVMDQLRAFCDESRIAIAFLGNLSGYQRLKEQKVAQIMTRVRGALVLVNLPEEDDINAILESWGLNGREVREFLTLIAHQDGGLHYLSDAVERARQYEIALGQPISLDLLKVCAHKAGAWGWEG
jgi:DNA transposition AAA+ family ATPase